MQNKSSSNKMATYINLEGDIVNALPFVDHVNKARFRKEQAQS